MAFLTDQMLLPLNGHKIVSVATIARYGAPGNVPGQSPNVQVSPLSLSLSLFEGS